MRTGEWDNGIEWISLREFAKRKGVNPNAVTQALENGRIQRRESDKKIHWPSQSKAWDDFRDLSKVRDEDPEDPEEAEEGGSAFNKAKTRKAIAEAGLKEHDLAVAHGEMIKVSHATDAMARFATDVREAVMGIPDRVASEVAADICKVSSGIDIETAREIVYRLWRRESRKALESIGNAASKRK